MTDSVGEHGVVTAAFGSRKYVEMAVDLALSLRAHSELPIAVVTGTEAAQLLDKRYNQVFDRIITIEPEDRGHPGARYIDSKVEAITNSPFRISLFLDADMICTADPSFLLNDIGPDDFRVFGRYHDATTCETLEHHGIPIAELLQIFGIVAYTYCSLAAFSFGNLGGPKVAQLLESEKAAARAVAERTGASFNDEVLLGMLGKRAGISFFNVGSQSYQALDMTFRWADEYAFIHPAPMRMAEASRILWLTARRRFKNSHPVVPSLFWFSDILRRRAEEAGRTRRMAHALQWALRWAYGT